jgi:hypothetical protein
MIARVGALTILLACSLFSQEQKDEWCAILRQDGLLVPLCLFDGSQWVIPAQSDFFIPHGIPRKWFFRPLSGSNRVITVGTPVRYEKFAQPPGLAFITDFCPRTTQTNVYPYPKAGIAFVHDVAFSQMLRSDTAESLTKQLIDTFAQIFNVREKVDPKKKNTPFHIQFLGQTVSQANKEELFYYFELVKTYPSGNCFSVSMYKGWARQSQAEITFLDDDISFGDCDGKGLSPVLRPFGSLLLGRRVFFIVEIVPYEGEGWSILEWRDKHLVDVSPEMYK